MTPQSIWRGDQNATGKGPSKNHIIRGAFEGRGNAKTKKEELGRSDDYL